MAGSRFDGAPVWERLSPEDQAAIGAAALEYAAADYACDQYATGIRLTPVGRAAQEALDVGCGLLLQTIVEAIPEEAFHDENGQALIPECLGPYCRECGCSENGACPEGCSWAEEDLCTACAGKARG